MGGVGRWFVALVCVGCLNLEVGEWVRWWTFWTYALENDGETELYFWGVLVCYCFPRRFPSFLVPRDLCDAVVY